MNKSRGLFSLGSVTGVAGSKHEGSWCGGVWGSGGPGVVVVGSREWLGSRVKEMWWESGDGKV